MRSAGAAHKNMEAPQSIDSGDARKWHLVTSHSYDTRERIVSHAWYEILRLSPHLFWLGLFTHRAFSSAQDDDTGGADGLLSGRYVACFGTSGVILRYK